VSTDPTGELQKTKNFQTMVNDDFACLSTPCSVSRVWGGEYASLKAFDQAAFVILNVGGGGSPGSVLAC
jgi:hypothetical protein